MTDSRISAGDGALGVPEWLGRLTATERRVWQAFPSGELVDLRSGDPDIDDPARAGGWPARRSVRAAVIAALLLGTQPVPPGRIAALRLAGARITGTLALENGHIPVSCDLLGCRFDERISLGGAETISLDLRGSRMSFFTIYGAHVRGMLDLTETVITGTPGRGLHADGIVIDNALVASRMAVTGPVSLVNGTIGQQLVLTGANLANRGDVALNLGGLHVGRSLIATGAAVEGEVRMPGARIESALVLDDARLANADGVALYAESISVASDLSARGLDATGQILLQGGRIGGGARFTGATLAAGLLPALRADRLTVGGSLYLNKGFRTADEVRLTGARIAGHLDLSGIDSPDALLTLYAVRLDAVRDDGPWPARLNLDNFEYRDLSPYRPARERIRLLTHQVKAGTHEPGGYRAQPYEQLAAYYRGLGHDEEARSVLLAKERTRRRTMTWPRRVPGWLLDAAVGYGYLPLRAVAWALGLLTFATVYFAHHPPVRVQRDDSAVFNPLLYAADQLVPLVHFGQQDVFQSRGIPAVVATVLSVVGWALSIAIAAAATRTLANN